MARLLRVGRNPEPPPIGHLVAVLRSTMPKPTEVNRNDEREYENYRSHAIDALRRHGLTAVAAYHVVDDCMAKLGF